MIKRLIVVACIFFEATLVMAQTRIPLDGKNKIKSVLPFERSSTTTLYTKADTLHYRELISSAYYALQKDSFEIAKSLFKEASNFIPRMDTNVEVFYQLGQLEEREGCHRNAIDYYTRAIKKNNYNIKASLRRGGMYLLLGEYEPAIKDFDNVTSVDNKNMDAYFFRGCAYANMKQYKMAVKDFTTVLQNNPLEERAIYSMALVELQQSKLKESCLRMNGLILRYPNNSLYYATRAEIYEKKGKVFDAEKDWQQAMDLSPNDIGIVERFAFFLARQHRKGDALKVLDRAESAGLLYTELSHIRKKVKRYK